MNTHQIRSARVVLHESGSVMAQADYQPFGEAITVAGVPMMHRKSFTDKETDTENGQADHGARKLDKRLDRFTSGDALWEKYRGLSPYVYVANNPLLFTDWSGDSLDFEGAASKTLFDDLYDASSTTVKAQYDKLRASDVTYYINISATLPAGKFGESGYNFTNDRFEILVSPSSPNNVGTLGDELTHASQFENGKIGYTANVRTLGYDMEDEVASKEGYIAATDAYNAAYGTSLTLAPSVAAYKAAKPGGDAAIEAYFRTDPDARNYLTDFDPAGRRMGVHISGDAGYTVSTLRRAALSTRGGIGGGFIFRSSGITIRFP